MRVRCPDIEHGLVIRVNITARHRRVLMAGDALQQVQLDTGIGHPGQRGMAEPWRTRPVSPSSVTR